jgi:hypothetical protein
VVSFLATVNNNFRIKNGLEVQGTTATVNGQSVLTSASGLGSLADVSVSSAANGDALVFNGSSWTPLQSESAGVVISPTQPQDTSVLWIDTDDESSSGFTTGKAIAMTIVFG